MPKLKIDLKEGLIEVDGDEKFVRDVYEDFKNIVTAELKTGEETPKKPAAKKRLERKPAKTTEKPKPRKPRRKKKETFSIAKDLDLSSKTGKKSLRDFYSEKGPANNMENNTVFIYYLEKTAKVEAINIDHVYTCYKNVKVVVPTALKQSLVDTSRRKGWIDTSSTEDMKITTPGENFIEFELPAKKNN